LTKELLKVKIVFFLMDQLHAKIVLTDKTDDKMKKLVHNLTRIATSR